jgi:hypothetical protein
MLMETSQRVMFLILLCALAILVGYGIYAHKQNKAKPPSELQTGVQVLTDPESVVKDLEK